MHCKHTCYRCIQSTQDIYSVVITRQSNPPIQTVFVINSNVFGQCFHEDNFGFILKNKIYKVVILANIECLWQITQQNTAVLIN